MMADPDDDDMASRRALLTDYWRNILSGNLDAVENIDQSDEDRAKQREYEVKSRVKTIIQDELPQDVDILVEHQPDLYAELIDAVVTDDGLRVLREQHPEVLDELEAAVDEADD